MVRTQAVSSGASRKVVTAQAPRKALGGGSSGNSSSCSSPSSSKNKYAGGNSVCDRPTPDWQKSIGGFLLQSTKAKGKENSTPSAEVEAGGNSECGSSQSSDARQSSTADTD